MLLQKTKALTTFNWLSAKSSIAEWMPRFAEIGISAHQNNDALSRQTTTSSIFLSDFLSMIQWKQRHYSLSLGNLGTQQILTRADIFSKGG